MPPGALLPPISGIPLPLGTVGYAGVPCLQGYVWRQAFPTDYACVTPATRSQAAQDDAAASSRLAGGGAYGPYTCIQGYVWRQALPNDYVCVTPAVRSQTVADDGQVDNRALLLRLWTSDWTPPAPTAACSGDTCTQTEGEWTGPDFQINGDHFNFGSVHVQVRRADGTLLYSQVVTATSYTGFPGAALWAQLPVADCSKIAGSHGTDYVIALDTVSGRWSAKLPINDGCYSF